MRRKNTVLIRSDPELKKIVEEVLETKPRKVHTSRITLAMARQYRRNPKLLRELKDAELK